MRNKEITALILFILIFQFFCFFLFQMKTGLPDDLAVELFRNNNTLPSTLQISISWSFVYSDDTPSFCPLHLFVLCILSIFCVALHVLIFLANCLCHLKDKKKSHSWWDLIILYHNSLSSRKLLYTNAIKWLTPPHLTHFIERLRWGDECLPFLSEVRRKIMSAGTRWFWSGLWGRDGYRNTSCYMLSSTRHSSSSLINQDHIHFLPWLPVARRYKSCAVPRNQ